MIHSSISLLLLMLWYWCCCCWWSTVNLWGTSKRQCLLTSLILLLSWRVSHSGLRRAELSRRQTANTSTWLLLQQLAQTESQCVHGWWAAVGPWLKFKAGFAAAKSSELLDGCCGFAHRTFARLPFRKFQWPLLGGGLKQPSARVFALRPCEVNLVSPEEFQGEKQLTC